MTPDDKIIPAPLLAEYRKPMSYGKKVFLMGLMCGVLMLGVLAIWIMSYSRESSNKEVAESITEQWGRAICIQGPIALECSEDPDRIRPHIFDCKAKVEAKSLHRGIYEAEVFTAGVDISGSFDCDSLRTLGKTVTLQICVDTRQIVEFNTLKIAGKEIPWQKLEGCLLAKVDLAGLPKTVQFSTDFDVRGSGALLVKQIGEHSTVTMCGRASNPSFNGYALPLDRQTSEDSFEAKWEDSVPRRVTYAEGDGYGYVGAKFLVGVDRYQKVARSMKYSFIIIILTFIGVLVVEIMRSQPIPLLNYFLIGAALILFYSLLLSFVELTSFGVAYLIASAMTVALITGYMWMMLQSRKLGLSIGGVLSLMYLFCYIMLSISTYALLLGSLLLFVSLAAMMYASLKLKK